LSHNPKSLNTIQQVRAVKGSIPDVDIIEFLKSQPFPGLAFLLMAKRLNVTTM